MGVTFDGVAANNIDLLANRNFLRNVAGGALMGWATLRTLGSALSLISISVSTSILTRAKISTTAGNGIDIRVRALDADTSAVFATPGGELNVNERFHLCATFSYTSKVGSLYINGALITNGVFTAITAGNTSNTAALTGTIGANEAGTANAWNGEIEDARVYGRYLGPGEVQTIYAARGCDGIVDGLEGRWALNDGAEGTNAVLLADLSSNQYSGLATGTLPFAGSTLRTGRFKKVTGRP